MCEKLKYISTHSVNTAMKRPNSKFSYISSLPDICQLDEATELYLMLQLPFLRLFFLIHGSSGRHISSLNK